MIDVTMKGNKIKLHEVLFINAINDNPNVKWMHYQYSIKIEIKCHGGEKTMVETWKLQTIVEVPRQVETKELCVNR
jgi:hypothetical protein